MKKSFLFLMLIMLLCTGCTSEALQPPEMPETSSPEVVESLLSEVDPEASLHLFDYDRNAPLEVLEESRTELKNGTLITLSYASPVGGRVPAQMILPHGQGPFPVIILQHGGLGRKEDLTDLGKWFASLGAATFMLDDPYTRPGGWEPTEYMGEPWPYFTDEDMDVKIQLIIDLQRAVDLLCEDPQIDADRLAYFGLSFGGAMGGLLAGIETRIQAYVLMVGDGGLVEHTSSPGPDGMNIHFNQDWADLMWPTESLHFVGRAAPAALLFQNGLHDENVLPSDAMRYYHAASEPKTLLWYDSDHWLPEIAFYDAALWLQPYIGADLIWFAPNFRSSASVIEALFLAWIAIALASCIGLIVLWIRTRKRTPVVNRVLWILATLLMGPVGLACFWLSRRKLDEDAPPGTANQALVLSVLGTTATLIGLIVADFVSDALPGMNSLLRLLIQYLVVLLVHGLFILGARPTVQQRATPVLLTTNLVFTLMLLIGNALAIPLRLVQQTDLRVLWPLALAGWIGVLITYPMHRWLVRREVERWTPQVVGEPAPLSRLSIWSSALSLSLTYVLILAAIVVVILLQSGLTLSEFMQALGG